MRRGTGLFSLEAFKITLQAGVKELGMSFDEGQISTCERYCRILLRENGLYNLTSITGEKEIAIKHFIDSLTCSRAGVFANALNIIDVGSGAGFPGLPLKIFWSEKKVAILESQEKKVRFLEMAVKEMGLQGVDIIKGRAEDAGRNVLYRGGFDLAAARAVAEISVLSEFCLPLVRTGGHFLAMKGPAVEDELDRGGWALEVLGGRVIEIVDVTLPISGDRRKIIVIEKTKETPEQYPRRAGIPKKKPLAKK